MKHIIVVLIGYKLGLMDLFGRNINSGSGYETTDTSDIILNNVIQISAGYQFDL